MDIVLDRFIKGLEDLKLRDKIEEIYLFGSRAKKRERSDSDYDLLLITKGVSKANREFREKIYDIAIDILLDLGRSISLKVFKKEEFQRLCCMRTPFTQNILREGIRIG